MRGEKLFLKLMTITLSDHSAGLLLPQITRFSQTLAFRELNLLIELIRRPTGNNCSNDFLSLKLFSLLHIWQGRRGKAKDYVQHVVKANSYSLRASDSQTYTISCPSNQKMCNTLFSNSFLLYAPERHLMAKNLYPIELIDALIHVRIDRFTNQQTDKKKEGLTVRHACISFDR